MLAQQPSNSGAGGDFPSTTVPPVYGGGKHEQDPAPGAGDLYYEWCNEGDDDRSRYLTSPHTPLCSFTGATPSPSDTPLVTPDMGAGMDIQGNFQDSDLMSTGRQQQQPPKLPPTDHLWTFSPSTPAVDSFEPVVPASDPVIPYAKKRRASASKKVVAFVDDEEEEEEEGSRLPPPPPTASEAQKIEYKRPNEHPCCAPEPPAQGPAPASARGEGKDVGGEACYVAGECADSAEDAEEQGYRLPF
ncbi:hypothetical protein MVEN_00979700 [Mycena venus]|uniref:Uncharacterized protein n=1 Tax=Mycena venus TaxID=2733690 RepID=A0A8H6YDR8_9AGAR|nr:hypothetical protein MVEN_00979700 [Mycena venus]